MAKLISNEAIVPDVHVMKVEGSFEGRMGQFYMLRGRHGFPLLARPISIYDIAKEHISFLYRVVGEGTRIFARMQPGEELDLEGPFGNGFPQVDGSLALIGGEWEQLRCCLPPNDIRMPTCIWDSRSKLSALKHSRQHRCP